ncbi:MAG: hypothetical protein NDI60_04195 [Elusimicrobiales bacterium]|nr:hypothetical protein [Elusimicrobiales bacterium]
MKHGKKLVLTVLTLSCAAWTALRPWGGPPPDLRDAPASGGAQYVASDDPNYWHVVNQKVLPGMRRDWKNYFSQARVGQVTDWAGGKLYRGSEGALFVDAGGEAIMLWSQSMDFNSLALNNRAIAAQWFRQYGFRPVGAPVNTRDGFSPDSFTRRISAYETAHPLIKWMVPIYNSLRPGGSRRWKNYTLIRAGNPGCLLIMDAAGEVNQLCVADDIRANMRGGYGGFLGDLADAVGGYQGG